MLKFIKEEKQKKILSEIADKIPLLENILIEQKKLLLLMLAIKKLSEKAGKTPEEINSLNEMIAMYVEKRGLTKDTIDPETANSAISTSVQNSNAENQSLFLQQLNTVKLRKLQQDSEENKSVYSQNSDKPDLISELKNALSEKKLKPVINF